MIAYVDVSERTYWGVYANAWDERNSGSGCSPDGCKPENTVDNDLDEQSRWSCAAKLIDENLEDEMCEICYTFGEPQDIIDLGIAFFMGDMRSRTLRATAHNSDDGSTDSYVFTSSGETSDYEYFSVYTDETELICFQTVGLDDDEWISLLEVMGLCCSLSCQ